jgi:hypothetical protein
MKKASTILAILAFGAAAGAAEYHVTPTGSASGNGSAGSPWDFRTATTSSALHGGDIVWVHGGRYQARLTGNDYDITVNGSAGNNIIFRNYNNEQATIDGSSANATLNIHGSYVTVWGLEITITNPTRTTPDVGQANPCAVSMSVYSPGCKIINCSIHDCSLGLAAYKEAPDSEFHGNSLYYNGWIGGDRNHGHGMYMQNLTGLKTIENNFVADNAAEGLQLYGSGSANVQGFRVNGNTVWNNGAWGGPNYQYNFLLANGNPRQDNQFHENYSYFSPQSTTPGGDNAIGQYNDGLDVQFKDSVFVGGYTTVESYDNATVTFTGNKVYHRVGEDLAMVKLTLGAGQTLTGYNWNNNQYFGGGYFKYSSLTDFNGWKAQTGRDANSTFTATAPTGKWVYVRPNKYETGRGNIIVFNWDKANAVDVDVSSVLSSGDIYEVRDAQNWYAATPVSTGTYAGGTISIPMTGIVKPKLAGLQSLILINTYPEFGTLIIRKTGTGSVIVYGDANGDGVFGMADINQMVDWILGRKTAPTAGSATFIASDVTGDGLVDMQDLNKMVDRLLGRIMKFPVEP